MEIESKALGVQTNLDIWQETCLWKCNKWAPKTAKSFTANCVATDYHGKRTAAVTGYGYIEVTYFSTRKEGVHPVDREMKFPTKKAVQ
jgi:hypothetical protein